MKLHTISFILLIIGGLNWLFVGIWGNDLFSWLGQINYGDTMYGVAKVVYVLIGLAAIYEVLTHKKSCKMCNKGGQMNS